MYYQQLSDGLEGKKGAYFQEDFSQRTNHVESAVLLLGVCGFVSENLDAEDHGLLQHLNTTSNAQGVSSHIRGGQKLFIQESILEILSEDIIRYSFLV